MQRSPLEAGGAAKIYLISYAAMLLLVLPAGLLQGDSYLFAAYALPQICFLGTIFLFARAKKIPFVEVIPVKKGVKPGALALIRGRSGTTPRQ